MRLRHFMQGTSMISACLKSACTLALAFAATGAFADHDERNPNVTKINPGDTVKVSRIPGSIYLRTQDDPDDLIWDRLPMYRTTLLPAPPVHQSVTLRFKNEVEEGKHMYFQVARSDERFYIRMHWKDASEDRDTTVDGFRDGVAVQYAINDIDTSYMMGTGPDNPVNIWYWRADHEQRIENLAAGGFGSTTALPDQDVTGASAYVPDEIIQDNEWHVVMSRPFKAVGEHEVNFDRDQVPMGFAVWQGSDEERDGNKRVTHTWILLDTSIDDGADADTDTDTTS